MINPEKEVANPMHIFAKTVPPELCDILLKDCETFGITKEFQNHIEVPKLHWFCGSMYNYGLFGNGEAGWNFNITGYRNMIFSGYTAPNMMASLMNPDDWLLNDPVLKRDMSGQQNKIVVLCQLSEGDNAGIYIKGFEDTKLQVNKGDVIVFPAFTEFKPVRPKPNEGKNYMIQLNLYGKNFV
jgi:hypothetical protein